MSEQFVNSFVANDNVATPDTTLNNGGVLGAGDVSLVVASVPTGVAAVGAPFRIKIDNEIIKVNTAVGTTWSNLERGLEGTAAAAHANGSKVYLAITAALFSKARMGVKIEIYDVVLPDSTNVQLSLDPADVTHVAYLYDDGYELNVAKTALLAPFTGRYLIMATVFGAPDPADDQFFRFSPFNFVESATFLVPAGSAQVMSQSVSSVKELNVGDEIAFQVIEYGIATTLYDSYWVVQYLGT